MNEEIDFDPVIDFDVPEVVVPNSTGIEALSEPPNRAVRSPIPFLKAKAVAASAEMVLQTKLQTLIQTQPEQFAGLDIKLQVSARPKRQPGASIVLRSLIELVLSSEGAAMTQTACRAQIDEKHPGFPIYKDWTVPLPQWARIHAAKVIAGAAVSLRQIKIGKATALRDIHAATKLALAKETDGMHFQPTVTVKDDCVIVNGTIIKVRMNKVSGGKQYATVRIAVPALLDALRASPK